MNSDLREIKRELQLGLKQCNSDINNSIVIVNPSKEKQHLNFSNSLFKDFFATLNTGTQIHNSNERTNWKEDIVRNYFYTTLTQTNQLSIRMEIISYVRNIFAYFANDQGLSILVYDTPNYILRKENVYKLINEIIVKNNDQMVCSFLHKLYNSRRIIHMDRSEIQDKVEIEDFLKQQVTNPINQERLSGYFAKQQISEDELRKCQISFQKQFDQQLDQVIGILLENFEKVEAQTIVEQEIVWKLVQFEEKVNNFQLGVQPIQEFSQIFMEAIQLLSSEQIPLDESILDDLNINMEIMDFYNRNQLGLKFEISLKVRVGLRLVDDLLKARKRKGYGSCTIM